MPYRDRAEADRERIAHLEQALGRARVRERARRVASPSLAAALAGLFAALLACMHARAGHRSSEAAATSCGRSRDALARELEVALASSASLEAELERARGQLAEHAARRSAPPHDAFLVRARVVVADGTSVHVGDRCERVVAVRGPDDPCSATLRRGTRLSTRPRVLCERGARTTLDQADLARVRPASHTGPQLAYETTGRHFTLHEASRGFVAEVEEVVALALP